MALQIKSKEATSIINALSGGVVPNQGIQHITVGREKEIDAVIQSMNEVQVGNSVIKFWIGDFGSGKSFILHLIKTIALRKNFIVAMTDFTPETRLYSNDRKAVALYTKIIDSISTQVQPDGNALTSILEKWIEKIFGEVAEENNLSFSDLREEKNYNLIENKLVKSVNEISDIGGYEFGLAIAKYFKGYVKDEPHLMKHAIRWLRGEYTAKTDAKNDLGIREIINDQNYYDMLKNFSKLFKALGYEGFIINLDEAINLYKISQSQTREKNYEKLLSIYNDCLQGRVSNLFINIGGTKQFLENERRGLFSYNAFKTRLEGNRFENSTVRDYSQPVIYLRPLDQNEIFVLLQKIRLVFNTKFEVEDLINDDEIKTFMESVLNKQGSNDLLTPREVIKEFINILSILRQNPDVDKQTIFAEIEVEKAENDANLDNIEII